MTFSYAVWIVMCVTLVLKLLATIALLSRVDRYIHKAPCQDDVISAPPDINIFILMPLLREQKVLSALMARFSHLLCSFPELSLIVITTERESLESPVREYSKPTTADLLSNLMSAYDDALKQRILHLHYPSLNKSLAEQLNYAVDFLLNMPSNTKTTYVSVYNADSVIDEGTARSLIARAKSGVPASQQSSLFLWNLPSMLSANQFYTGAHALYQSCWTLQHEIPRYLFCVNFIKWLPRTLEEIGLVHCVGHGLLIKLDVLAAVGRFPVLSLGGDDLALGFMLKVAGFHVFPIHRLENAESPDNPGVLWRQLAGWYLATLGYFVFWRLLPKRSLKTHFRRVVLISLLGLLDSLKWLFKGPIVVTFFLLAYANSCLTVAIVLYLLYFYIPLGYLFRLWFSLPEHTFPRPPLPKLKIATAAYWLVPIVRSAPAWLGLFWGIRIALGLHFLKPKTERL